MKKLLLTAAAVLATLNMYGQGTVLFSNIGAADPNKVWLNAVGTANGGTLAPAGTTANYRVALYYAPDGTGTDSRQYLQIGNAAVIGPTPGLFSGGNRTIPASAAGSGNIVNFQVRGWNGGATYDEALANTATGWVGNSEVFRIDTAFAPTDPILSVLGNANFATGWQGFAISPVPEPSAIALGLLGAGALLMLRRRK